MLASFLVVFPIFAVIAMGWASSRFNILRQETGNGIADYVFVIAIPLMLFRTLATAPLPATPPIAFWAAYFLPLGIIWIIAVQVAQRLFGRGGQEAAIIAFTAAQSNMVLLGIPLVLRVFGEAGSVPLFLLVGLNLPIVMTIATIAIERDGGNKSKMTAILLRLARNPVLVGIFAGMAYRLTGFDIPSPLLTILKFIGDSAAPCALFAAGMSLSRHSIGDDRLLLGIVTGLKLVIHPALVFLAARHVFHLPPVWTGVATVLAGCPCGVNAYLMAERYKLGMGLSSGALTVSTIVAVVTNTMIVWMVLG